MKMFKGMLPYLAAVIFGFYFLPMFIKDTGSAMLVLLVLIPMLCFGASLLFGLKYSFDLLYVLIVAVLFIPAMFLYYNESAWVYIVMYGVVAAAGNGVGTVLYKWRKDV